jgi:G3E family GTPase
MCGQVKEIINGCLCCVLVGQLGTAIEELVKTQAPDRIIIETSGSAYPAPLAWELRKYEPLITLDGIVTVRASFVATSPHNICLNRLEMVPPLATTLITVIESDDDGCFVMRSPQVIDALNFPGYDDKSWTAKQQAMYTDLILINKHELVTDERTLDKTLDDVHELNPETPKVTPTKPHSLKNCRL